MLLLLLLYLTATLANAGENPPVVNTKYGPVRGTVLKSIHGENYVAYMGIPYAKPPVGELRFQAPQPPEKWTEIFDATKDASACLQFVADADYGQYTIPSGKEDCLTLNIYLPKDTRAGDKLDVMFHIHGGAFLAGSGNKEYFDLAPLVAKGVLIVSINYRLGIFGFLSTGNDVVPGNNGLKDQVMAMKWTRDNIAAFGGNPDSVTIFGSGAGGMSVHAHYLSPMSRGLFHRAIAESGVITSGPVLDRSAPQKAMILAKLVKCPTYSSQAMVQCLRNKDGHSLLDTTKRVYKSFISIPFGPVVESSGDDRFFAKHPWFLIDDGDFAQVPFMTGVRSFEWIRDVEEYIFELFPGELLHCVNANWKLTIQMFFEYYHIENHKDNIADKIRQLYFGGKDSIDSTNFAGMMIGARDRVLLSPMYKAVQRQAAVSNSPTFVYQLSFLTYSESIFSAVAPTPLGDYGMLGAGDISHCLMDKIFTEELDSYRTENDKLMTGIITTLWTNFAKSGNPNSPDSSLSFKWDPISADNVKFLNITLTPEMKEGSSWPMDRINIFDILHEEDLKITAFEGVVLQSLFPQQHMHDEF